MLTVPRLPERLWHAEVLGVAEWHVGPQVRRAHLAKSCVDILPRGEARDGEHGVQFMDAAKREVFGLLEAGAFEIVDE